MTYGLAACAEVLFEQLDFNERVLRLNGLGLEATMWSWVDKDLEQLAAHGAAIASMTGHLTGNLLEPSLRAEYIEGVERSLDAAGVVGCRTLILHPAEILGGGRIATPVESTTGPMWISIFEGLRVAASRAEEAGVKLLLENLNRTVDHAGAPLSSARDVIEMVTLVGSDHLGVCLDVYHAQVDHGNVVELIAAAGSLLGDVQVADVPGRHEPGTGELRFAFIAEQLCRRGYGGTVSLEAWPINSSDQAIDAFVAAFEPGENS